MEIDQDGVAVKRCGCGLISCQQFHLADAEGGGGSE